MNPPTDRLFSKKTSEITGNAGDETNDKSGDKGKSKTYVDYGNKAPNGSNIEKTSPMDLDFEWNGPRGVKMDPDLMVKQKHKEIPGEGQMDMV